ncbi:hypothetical protein HAX54_044237 [Datura stramonium]|uniref:Uncharacterized protein n=1 Tax=Datura stramonium TaxID=4076 RepID=A0ABS8W3R0_DATST|nr:hypothetical protein [Datura stramonium]
MRGVEKAKQKHRKGLWSPDEDQKLKDYILKHGHDAGVLSPSMLHNNIFSSTNVIMKYPESLALYLKKRVARKTENIDSVSSPCSGYSSLEGSLSLADSDRSDFQKGPRKSNLPKVLFAEWFSLDQFSDQNSDLPKNNFGYNNSEFQDAFMHDLYMSEALTMRQYTMICFKHNPSLKTRCMQMDLMNCYAVNSAC